MRIAEKVIRVSQGKMQLVLQLRHMNGTVVRDVISFHLFFVAVCQAATLILDVLWMDNLDGMMVNYVGNLFDGFNLVAFSPF